MRRILQIAGLISLPSALFAQELQKAQVAEQPAAVASSAPELKAIDPAIVKSVDALVTQLRLHPCEPSTAAGRVGLYLIEAGGGEATLIASQPDPWLNQCGSPAWSSDGQRILFDATPGTADFSLTRLKAIHLVDGHLAVTDLGPGNCPNSSPQGDRVIFLLNGGAVPGAEAGVWLMNADGSDRKRLGGYGRPRWSPNGHQFMIVSFSEPNEITVIDDRPDHKSGALQIADQKVFAVPSWAGPETIVAALGEAAAETIALVDITDPTEAKVKETLWKRGKDLDVVPYRPAYAQATRRLVFIGKTEGKGRALYTLEHGKSGPPRRLEPDVFDNLIQDPIFSPDGRYLVFSSDRPDRRPAKYPDPGRRPLVEAPALSGITIDGDLKDWPVAMERHAISNLQTFPPRNGMGGLEHAFFSTSPDLSASFSVGYDPKEQLIYLAVIVRDDQLIVGTTSSWDTDAIEVFVDGLHSDTRMPYPQTPNWVENLSASDVPVLQYIGLPGKGGPVYGFKKSAGVERSGEDNPILMFGDIKQTKTRMAFRREGDVTTYEWAIQAFDHYPDKPTRLAPGMKLGFDVVVADKDKPAQTPEAANDPEEDRAAWISWGPALRIQDGDSKSLTANKLGEIVLGRIPRP